MTALQPVERCFILDQSRLVRAAQPESIAAMVGFVPDEDIPRCPALDAIVVRPGAIVALELIPGAAPTVEYTDEDSVSAMRTVILKEAIVVRSKRSKYLQHKTFC